MDSKSRVCLRQVQGPKTRITHFRWYVLALSLIMVSCLPAQSDAQTTYTSCRQRRIWAIRSIARRWVELDRARSSANASASVCVWNYTSCCVHCPQSQGRYTMISEGITSRRPGSSMQRIYRFVVQLEEAIETVAVAVAPMTVLVWSLHIPWIFARRFDVVIFQQNRADVELISLYGQRVYMWCDEYPVGKKTLISMYPKS